MALYNREIKNYAEETIKSMPRSNGSRRYCAFGCTIGIVADKLLYNNYTPTCRLQYLTPDNYGQYLDKLDCLLISSTWRGLHNEWVGAFKQGSKTNMYLMQLIHEAKKKGLLVVFYSKEDPANYHHFLHLARQADYIFTSAEECIVDYERDAPGIPVSCLGFGVNPLLHNPIGMCREKRVKAVFFAGSWMKKYPKRITAQKNLFQWVQDAGKSLEIVDRNFFRKQWDYAYPLKYYRQTIPQMEYEVLAPLYKCYRWVLNLNSVTESKTMLAMRIYDALACGNLIISNESNALSQSFPEVFVVQSKEDVRVALEEDVRHLELRQRQGIRHVLGNATVFHQMGKILHTVGIIPSLPELHTVAVVVVDPSEWTEEDSQCVEHQSYPNKKLILGLQSDISLKEFGAIALWCRDYQYEQYYLEDMMNGFAYTACDYVTRHFVNSDEKMECGVEHEYTQNIMDPFFTVFWNDNLTGSQLMEMSKGVWMKSNGYASDSVGMYN